MGKLSYFGNREILKEHKTAFLCSRKYPPEVVLKAYDWAIEQRDKGNCVISGFHSQIEKDVFHFLMKGTQPIIMVLARGMKKRWESEISGAIEAGQLLVISPFDENVIRVTAETAKRRNQLILDLADRGFVAYASPGGNISNLLKQCKFDF